MFIGKFLPKITSMKEDTAAMGPALEEIHQLSIRTFVTMEEG